MLGHFRQLLDRAKPTPFSYLEDFKVKKKCLFVCCLLFVAEERYYAFLNTNELWRTIALIYVNVGQYYTVSQRASDQEKEKVF